MKNLFYFSLILFFISCSINKPYISSLSCKRLVVELDSGRVTERLSVFVRFNDEDGANDYDSMTIFQKNTGLYWHINRSLSSFFKTKLSILWEGFHWGSMKCKHKICRAIKFLTYSL